MTKAPPWWTDADRAELDAIAWALVDGIYEHRERCAACIAGWPPCPSVGKAVEVAADWCRFRALRSRADWQRVRQEVKGRHAA
jgi:hypothetical protein